MVTNFIHNYGLDFRTMGRYSDLGKHPQMAVFKIRENGHIQKEMVKFTCITEILSVRSPFYRFLTVFVHTYMFFQGHQPGRQPGHPAGADLRSSCFKAFFRRENRQSPDRVLFWPAENI